MRNWHFDHLIQSTQFFEVLATTGRTQFATMTLAEGQTSGEFGTDHPQADQTLIVLAGEGIARIEEHQIHLSPGSLILIEAGEKHQIEGRSSQPLVTANIYSPVAYPEERGTPTE